LTTTEIIILVLFTLLNAWFNWWISLREKRYHAFFRFVSFESIFLLVLVNYPVWFKYPLSPLQVTSWSLLTLSLLVATWGFVIFYTRGKPEDKMEKTTELITNSIYKYIRHPLYLSLILVGFGVMIKDPGVAQIILSLLNFIAIFFTARVEEKEMVTRFGPAYSEYMKKSKMFFPFIL
jgi:protein-S-isoprenylcysteine O-methyltransferase Ste14